jgi:TolA-binding protein
MKQKSPKMGLTQALITEPIGVVLIFMVSWLSACSGDHARNHYLLAEKLWADQKYSAAVVEFEKVITKDPGGQLGLQAMYRAAMTQYLFLSQYGDAVRKLRSYIQLSSDSQRIWEAQIQVGEILFSKAEQYEQAIIHYQFLLKQKPNAGEAPEFLYRIGKSHFFLFHFSEAVRTYQELIRTYPHSSWSKSAEFEIGISYFTQESYEKAMESFKKYIQKYPQSEKVPEANFGIASCLEELDRLEEAYEIYQTLKKIYPSPQVVAVKLARIRERLSQRGNPK